MVTNLNFEADARRILLGASVVHSGGYGSACAVCGRHPKPEEQQVCGEEARLSLYWWDEDGFGKRRRDGAPRVKCSVIYGERAA